MEILRQLIEKEISDIEQCGLTVDNYKMTGELIDMLKDIQEIKANGGEDSLMYGTRYWDGYPNEQYYRDSNMNRGNTGGNNYGRRYRGDGFLDSRLDRIIDNTDLYQYMKSRYRDGGSEDRMVDGLEKLMYALCSFVESVSDFAETPQEKEVIRKHLQKLQSM